LFARKTHVVIALLAALLLTAPCGAQPWRFDNVARIVAMSDIHGAYEAMLQTLRNAAVLDTENAWSGGSTHLVIVGDILDRGPDSRKVMDFLMRIEDEALAAGGMLHVLIGNHEAMNMSGDLRYVSSAEYAAFAAEESDEERERWFAAYLAKRAPPGTEQASLRAEFEKKFPPGYFAHRRAFSPQGKYGQWLLSKPVIIIINGTAFVHGGLPPLVTELGLQGVNGDLMAQLADYLRGVQSLVDAEILLPTDEDYHYAELLQGTTLPESDTAASATIAEVLRLGNSRLQAPDGPLWYRQDAYCGVLIEGDRLDQALAAIGAQRVVIGHTTTDNRRVQERFGGRIYEIDTGILTEYYRGSGSALVIEDERLYVVTQSGGEPQAPFPHPRQVGRMTGTVLRTEAIEQALQQGELIARSNDSAGRTIVTLRYGENTLDAEFIKRERAGVLPDVAAYRLDRMLQLDMVPVAVPRTLDKTEGSMQFVPVQWIDERQRQAKKSGGNADCYLPDQWELLPVFDTLIGNNARTAESMRYDTASFQLMLVGHDRAFPTSAAAPARYKDVPLKMGPSWKAALTSLSDEMLQQQLGDVLDQRRLKALGERRDLLLSE